MREPPHPLLVGLGIAIREQREQRRLSQEALSLATGVHRNYIGGVERAERRPSIVTIAVLAEALGLRASQLLERAEQATAADPEEF